MCALGALAARDTKKIAEIVDYKYIWKVLGYRNNPGRSTRVVLATPEIENPIVVWANKQLENVLERNKNMVQTNRYTDGRILGWIPGDYTEDKIGIGIYIHIDPPRPYTTKEGKEIVWYPVRETTQKDKENIAQLEVPEMPIELPEKMQEIYNVPQAKDTMKAMEMEPGEYVCRKFACTTYRGNEKTILYLSPVGKDGNPTTDEEIAVQGFFLHKEIERIGGKNTLQQTNSPIYCKLLGTKTTPQKNKDRNVSIAL